MERKSYNHYIFGHFGIWQTFINTRTDIFFIFISLCYLNTILSEIIMLSAFYMTKNIQIIIYYLRYMVEIQNGRQ